MGELILNLPPLVMLVLLVWYLRIVRRTLRLGPGSTSPLMRQLELMGEVRRSGELAAELAQRQAARITTIEGKRAARPQ